MYSQGGANDVDLWGSDLAVKGQSSGAREQEDLKEQAQSLCQAIAAHTHHITQTIKSSIMHSHNCNVEEGV